MNPVVMYKVAQCTLRAGVYRSDAVVTWAVVFAHTLSLWIREST